MLALVLFFTIYVHTNIIQIKLTDRMHFSRSMQHLFLDIIVDR